MAQKNDDTITCRRFLGRELRWKDGRMTLALVCKKDGGLRIEPFSGETHSTIFLDSIVELRNRDGLASVDDSSAYLICTTGEDELKTITLDNNLV